jgi:murein DD-endopeptidase MepM/ murein hydrolase activator NlpD
VSSEYGIRWGKLHKGIDITGNKGQGIVASAKGKVMSIGWVRGYGYTVVLQHQTMAQGRPHVFRTLYAHCQKKMLVKKGDTVEQGQKIALMGRTGNATAFLLHFEYRNSSNKPENPRSVLPQRKDLQLYSYAR